MLIQIPQVLKRDIRNSSMDGWEQVFSHSFMPKVVLAKELLNAEEIPSIILNKQDSFYLIGDIELRVPGEHVIRARRILAKFEHE